MQDVWPRNSWSLGIRGELKDRFYKWLKGCNYKQGGLAASSELVSELKRLGFNVEVGEEDEFQVQQLASISSVLFDALYKV